MSSGIERRAQIDADTFKALIALNGGGAVALLAFLQAIVDKAGFQWMMFGTLVGLPILMIGLVLAVIHNRLRRLCSLVYEQHNMHPPRGKIFGIQLREPRVCAVSTGLLYSSLASFVLAGVTVAATGLLAIYRVNF